MWPSTDKRSAELTRTWRSLRSSRPLRSLPYLSFSLPFVSRTPGLSRKPSHSRPSLLAMLLCLSMSMTFLSGCVKPPSEEPEIPKLVLEPTLVYSTTLSGWAWTNEPSQAISPDGRYLLLAQHDSDATRLVAFPLPARVAGDEQNSSEPGKFQDEPVVLRSVDRQWTIDNGLEYIPIGWLSDNECLFVSSGKQDQGKHRNKQGISVLAGDITQKQVRELAFIPLEYALVRNAALDTEHNMLILDASNSIITVDLESYAVNTVKQEPPTFQGSLAAELSPDRTAAVYNLHEEGKNGVYMLDLGTAAETPLIPSGDTMSFYPVWSPDGQYVAAYTVARKPGADSREAIDTSAMNYELYLGEDSPMPFGASITIVDKAGQPVNEVSITGRILGHLKWSADSKHIGFVSCAKPKPAQIGATSGPDGGLESDAQGNWEIPSLRADSMWIADVATGATAKIADLSSISTGETVSIYPLAFSPDSKGLFYQVIQEKSNSIWYGAKDQAQTQPGQTTPVKVIDGLWYENDPLPVFDNQLSAIIGETGATGGTGNPGGAKDPGESGNGTSAVGLWLLGDKGFLKASQWQAVTGITMAHNEQTLVIYSYLGNDQFEIRVYSMYITAQ